MNEDVLIDLGAVSEETKGTGGEIFESASGEQRQQ